MVAGQSRVPEGDRAQESDSARGVLQLTLTSGFQEYRRCGELDGGVDDTPALGHDFLADPVTGIAAIRCFMRTPPSASS